MSPDRGSAKNHAKASSKTNSKEKKNLQGKDLPPDGSPLSAYPVGACVLLQAPDDPTPTWHIVSFRIGGSGNPHVARMSIHPSSESWYLGRSGSVRSVSDSLIVLSSAWPNRDGMRAKIYGDAAGSTGSDDVDYHVRVARPDQDQLPLGAVYRSSEAGPDQLITREESA